MDSISNSSMGNTPVFNNSLLSQDSTLSSSSSEPVTSSDAQSSTDSRVVDVSSSSLPQSKIPSLQVEVDGDRLYTITLSLKDCTILCKDFETSLGRCPDRQWSQKRVIQDVYNLFWEKSLSSKDQDLPITLKKIHISNLFIVSSKTRGSVIDLQQQLSKFLVERLQPKPIPTESRLIKPVLKKNEKKELPSQSYEGIFTTLKIIKTAPGQTFHSVSFSLSLKEYYFLFDTFNALSYSSNPYQKSFFKSLLNQIKLSLQVIDPATGKRLPHKSLRNYKNKDLTVKVIGVVLSSDFFTMEFSLLHAIKFQEKIREAINFNGSVSSPAILLTSSSSLPSTPQSSSSSSLSSRKRKLSVTASSTSSSSTSLSLTNHTSSNATSSSEEFNLSLDQLANNNETESSMVTSLFFPIPIAEEIPLPHNSYSEEQSKAEPFDVMKFFADDM